jgi:hypothetical protein
MQLPDPLAPGARPPRPHSAVLLFRSLLRSSLYEDHCGQVRASGLAHQMNIVGIPANFVQVVQGPFDRVTHVTHHTRDCGLREVAIVRANKYDSIQSKDLAHEKTPSFVTYDPRPASDKYNYRVRFGLGFAIFLWTFAWLPFW